MENATKAFLMVAGILIGVLILALGLYIFSIFGQYSENAYQAMEEKQTTQFNNQFLKYYGKITRSYIDEKTKREKTVQEPIKCTAHDIITLANLAQENNKYYQVDSLNKYDENTNYIQIDIKNQKNIEKWNEDKKIQFITQNSTRVVESTNSTEIKYYYIKDQPIISGSTKKVCYIKFMEFDE
mgnify:CR=1 FL=1